MTVVVNRLATGVYMAFPTTSVLKPIYRKLKTQVNDRHTKVGITIDSFAVREREYKKTFGGEVEFVPLAEVPAQLLAAIESKVLEELCARFQRVGHAREWFSTTEREVVAEIVLSVVRKFPSDGT